MTYLDIETSSDAPPFVGRVAFHASGRAHPLRQALA